MSCQAPRIANISSVIWKKRDLKHRVYMKRDGDTVTRDQDPSYAPRVDLVDGEMKNGNLSLIMKNVTSKDSGVYNCSYGPGGNVTAVIYLTVTDPAAKDGDAEDGIQLLVVLVACGVIFGIGMIVTGVIVTGVIVIGVIVIGVIAALLIIGVKKFCCQQQDFIV
ncbi:titin-like%2C partial [Scomber scombrus]|uniref:Titin-like, partial n=1 Tax=Scomber scombrus TaxID=13677 RepID=A0AAV1PU04_SCOSC